MTECERIIKERILPKNFFDEEVICDFLVTTERKKIWGVGIDLLIKFDTVCRAHHLHYSLAFGSLLGVVRHKGFIPWDDDVDVVMPRSDYEKLKEYKDEFTEPYFLQYPGKDEGYAFSFAKLRNSNTTGISWAFRYESFNQGMFLDIFPLDSYCPENIVENMERITTLVEECSVNMRRSCPVPDENDLLKIAKYPIARNVEILASELDSVLRQYEYISTDKYIIWSCLFYQYEKVVFKRSFFDNLKEVDFYGHPIFIPLNYDAVLSVTYGDYMQFPPVESRGTWHSSSLFNPDVPYKESQEKLWKEDKIKFKQ